MKPLVVALLLAFSGTLAGRTLPGSTAPADSAIQAILPVVSTASISGYIQGLENFTTRHWSNGNRDTVSSWIRSSLLATGLTDVRFDSFAYSGTTQRNVVATMPGNLHPEMVIVIGGHYDSQASDAAHAYGADDNASGTAAVIEMARVLQAVQYQPSVTLKFVAFAAEEAGLLGSAAYAAKCRAQGMDIRLMMNFDMIGHRDTLQGDRDLYVVTYAGSEPFSNLFAALSTDYTGLTPIFTSAYRSSSDSYSFYQYGYDTFFTIERDFSPFYHTPNDRLVYLDIPYAREVIQAGLATLLQLDRVPPRPQLLSVRDCGNGSSLAVSVPADALPDRSFYAIFVGSSPGSYDMTFSSTSPSFTVLGLTEGKQYFVGVSIVDELGLESPVIETSAVPRSVPLPPAQFTVIASSPPTVTFSWHRNDEMDLAGYRLYRMFVADTGFTLVKTIPQTDTLATDTLTRPCLYVLKAIDTTGLVSAPSETVQVAPLAVEGDHHQLPRSFVLEQNYPNPFNPATTIRFSLPHRETVRLRIFDLLGREIALLINGVREAGITTIMWNPSGASGGVYYYQLETPSGAITRSMMLAK